MIVQEAFLQAYRKLSRFRNGSFRAWLADRSPSVEELIEQSEFKSMIRRSLNELIVEYRTVLVLVDLLDFDYAGAAGALGVPIGTVKSRLARARLQLRRRMEAKAGFPLPGRFSGLQSIS